MGVNSKIQDYIEFKGLKSVEIAKRMGISKQNLSRILNSDDLKVSQLIEISKHLGVVPTYFFDGTETVDNEELEKLREDNKMLRTQIKLIEQNFRNIIDLEFQMKINVIKNDLSYWYEDDVLDFLIKEAIAERDKGISLAGDINEIFKNYIQPDELAIRKKCRKKIDEISGVSEDSNDNFIQLTKEDFEAVLERPEKKIGLADLMNRKKK